MRRWNNSSNHRSRGEKQMRETIRQAIQTKPFVRLLIMAMTITLWIAALIAAMFLFGGCVSHIEAVHTIGPNHAAEHDANLHRAIDRSIHISELEDKYPYRMYIYDNDGNLDWIYN
jgi:hypothetical protein